MFRPLLISLFITSTALATTWTVDDDGKADFENIQAAVDAASDGDEIVVMPGIYISTTSEVVNPNGKELWIHSSQGAKVTVIDGQLERRGLVCISSETNKTIIEGFTVTNCDYSGPDGNDGGGGMYNAGSSPTLTNCSFTGNHARHHGGGMFNNNSSPTLTNCIFENNSPSDNNHDPTRTGGGMLNKNGSNPTLANCTFENNGALGRGGGMSNYSSSPTLENCTFENNSAFLEGGGMYNYNSSPTLTDTVVCGNTPDQIYGDWTDNGGNWVEDECPIDCPADINGDGYVDVSDLLAIIDQWGLTNSPADVNDDGIVDVSDILIVIGNWGVCE